MNGIKAFAPLITVLFMLVPQLAWAWGDRAHHIMGYSAAALTDEFLSDKDRDEVDLFFSVRKNMMGHLNNIPDIQWKDKRFDVIAKLNRPTHYFDADDIVGLTGTSVNQEKVEQIRNLPTDPTQFITLYANRPSALANSVKQKLNIFQDVGVAPFYVNHLYNLLVSSFQCAKGILLNKNIPQKKKNEFQEPIQNGTFVCDKNKTYDESLAASVEISGVMGHYLADLSQPLHVSTDYDGFSTGQAGVHQYIESYALHYLDENLTRDVIEKAKSKSFQKELWRKLAWPNNKIDQSETSKKSDKKMDGGRVSFHLIANSISHLSEMLALDKKYALKKESEIIPIEKIQGQKINDAERRPPSDPKVLAGIRSFVVNRMAVAALIQARLMIQAWTEGGKPPLKGVSHFAYPYPTRVPFILPPNIFWDGLLNKSEQRRVKKQL